MPFWEHDQLVVCPEFRPWVDDSTDGIAAREDSPGQTSTFDGPDAESEAAEDSELESEEANFEDLSDEEVDESSEDEADGSPDPQDSLAILQSALDIAQDQLQKGNREFVDRFIASNAANLVLVEEVDKERNRKSMGRTWFRHRHPATMYWN